MLWFVIHYSYPDSTSPNQSKNIIFIKAPLSCKNGPFELIFINFQQKSLLLTRIGDILEFVIRLMHSPIG